jgi:hypothetical protein
MQILHLLGQPASKFAATLISSEVIEREIQKNKQRKGAHIASTVYQVVTVRSIKHDDE